jgi:predicted restriction endonuclease
MNGLCLNALHDRAFDNGLISIDESYKVIISKKVKHKLILQYDRKPIKMPDRFLPDQKFLSYHRENIFLRN